MLLPVFFFPHVSKVLFPILHILSPFRPRRRWDRLVNHSEVKSSSRICTTTFKSYRSPTFSFSCLVLMLLRRAFITAEVRETGPHHTRGRSVVRSPWMRKDTVGESYCPRERGQLYFCQRCAGRFLLVCEHAVPVLCPRCISNMGIWSTYTKCCIAQV